MNNLFLLLFLASFVCLIVGLVKPTAFSRFIKGEITRKKIGLIFGIATFVFFVLFGITTNTDKTKQSNTNNQTTEKITEQKREIKILQEQKAKAENLTKAAVNLITEDKISEAIALYNERWNELAKLRVEILYDKDLSDAQKNNIDKALKSEQESITAILSQYQQLYR